jgi:hypothetical protein
MPYETPTLTKLLMAMSSRRTYSLHLGIGFTLPISHRTSQLTFPWMIHPTLRSILTLLVDAHVMLPQSVFSRRVPAQMEYQPWETLIGRRMAM